MVARHAKWLVVVVGSGQLVKAREVVNIGGEGSVCDVVVLLLLLLVVVV